MPLPAHFSYVDYVSAGTTANFGVTFPYLSQVDVTVTVNGVLVAFTWLTPSTVQLAAIPANGTAVRVQRNTDITQPIVSYSDGSTLAAADLAHSNQQLLYSIQELRELMLTIQASINTLVTVAGNLPVVTSGNNGQLLQVVSGVWTLVTTNTTTVVQDEQVDGTNMLIQKKTAPLVTIGVAPTISGWTTIHTGSGC